MRRALTWLAAIAFLAIVVSLLTVLGTAIRSPERYLGIGALGSVQFVLNTNAAALTSAMSVLIALVLLTVQLTTQRYSFNVIGIFLSDRVNAGMLALYITTITYNLWLSLVLAEDYIPDEAVVLAMLMMTLCFAMLPPYILYLFDVVRPDHMLNRLQRDLRDATRAARRSNRAGACREDAARRIAQIGDIARTAVNLSDGAVARHAVWVLYGSVAAYVDEKRTLPPDWFAVEDQHFRGRHELIRREIRETQTWVERHMLDELREIFNATLNRMHDVNTTVALVLRLLGEKALAADDEGLFRAVAQFFNTFLRAAINGGDVRAGYHALYQYRLLADAAMDGRPAWGLEIADRLTYYGDAAAGGPLLWMSAAAAYDLRVLAERVHARGMDPALARAVVDDLLETVARGEAKASPALPQLYKMVVALGAYFVANGADDLARTLRAALAGVPADLLERCAAELRATEDPRFWELTDRVVNFDYVEPPVRAAIEAFLADVTAAPAGDAVSRRPAQAASP
jgi:hypothetical protein